MFRILSVLVKQWPVPCALCPVTCVLYLPIQSWPWLLVRSKCRDTGHWLIYNQSKRHLNSFIYLCTSPYERLFQSFLYSITVFLIFFYSIDFLFNSHFHRKTSFNISIMPFHGLTDWMLQISILYSLRHPRRSRMYYKRHASFRRFPCFWKLGEIPFNDLWFFTFVDRLNEFVKFSCETPFRGLSLIFGVVGHLVYRDSNVSPAILTYCNQRRCLRNL